MLHGAHEQSGKKIGHSAMLADENGWVTKKPRNAKKPAGMDPTQSSSVAVPASSLESRSPRTSLAAPRKPSDALREIMNRRLDIHPYYRSMEAAGVQGHNANPMALMDTRDHVEQREACLKRKSQQIDDAATSPRSCDQDHGHVAPRALPVGDSSVECRHADQHIMMRELTQRVVALQADIHSARGEAAAARREADAAKEEAAAAKAQVRLFKARAVALEAQTAPRSAVLLK